MAENTKVTSEEVKEEKVELISRDRIDQVTCLWHLGF